MEVPKMEGKNESHLISPAAFVDGGIQEACDDSCSICLEAFCDDDPKSVTGCKHEFHLQCILEWCQRSSNCPMCWQEISLKDPSSQELLEAVEQERRFKMNPARNSTILHHPTLGDFELHLPVGVNGSELEDRIIQHLAAAAAMGRSQNHMGRREGSRNRGSTVQSRPQFLVFSANPNGPSGGMVQVQAESAAADSARSSVLSRTRATSETSNGSNSQPGTSTVHRSTSSLSSLPDQDRAGPSDLQAASDTWKSRFSAFSTRWKDKLFNKSPSMSNIGSEVTRDVNVSRLEVRENNRQDQSSSSSLVQHVSDPRESNHNCV